MSLVRHSLRILVHQFYFPHRANCSAKDLAVITFEQEDFLTRVLDIPFV